MLTLRSDTVCVPGASDGYKVNTVGIGVLEGSESKYADLVDLLFRLLPPHQYLMLEMEELYDEKPLKKMCEVISGKNADALVVTTKDKGKAFDCGGLAYVILTDDCEAKSLPDLLRPAEWIGSIVNEPSCVPFTVRCDLSKTHMLTMDFVAANLSASDCIFFLSPNHCDLEILTRDSEYFANIRRVLAEAGIR